MIRTGTRRVWLLLALVFCSSLLFSTATVSGNLQDAGGGAVSSRTFVRFWLRGCANNQPRVNGVALIVPPGGPGYYKDFVPDAGGAMSGAIYKNSEIECNGLTGNTWYGVQVFRDGKPGPETPYSVVAATFNLNTATPTVQAPPPPPATFPYIMANPIAAQTISNFPLGFGTGSGISANYQGSVRAAGTYLRSDGSSFFAPVSGSQLASDIVSLPSVNGLAYWNGTLLSTTPTGGAGTLCLVSTNGGAPAFSSCAGSSSTAWSALSAPSANLALSMGPRTTAFTWGTGTGANTLFSIDGSGGNGSGATLLVKGQPAVFTIMRVEDSAGNLILEVFNSGVILGNNFAIGAGSFIGQVGIPLQLATPSGGIGLSDIFIFPGPGESSSMGGTGHLFGGQGGPNNGDGGFAGVGGGVGVGTGVGGSATLGGGQGGSNAKGGDSIVVGGTAGGGNNNGGNVIVRGGTKAGSGTAGVVEVQDPSDTTKKARILPGVLAPGGVATVGIALTGTASLDYDLSGGGITCQDLTVTVTGAVDGDAVSIGVPNALASTVGVTFTGFVSASNTVTVRACDVTSGNPNPAAATVRAAVWKF